MTSQEERSLRTKARSINADLLARAIGVEATALRRWINGGVDPNMTAKVNGYMAEL